MNVQGSNKRRLPWFFALMAVVLMVGAVGAAGAQNAAATQVASPTPRFTTAVAFDKSPALSSMPKSAATLSAMMADDEPVEVRADRGPEVVDQGYSGDGALQTGNAGPLAAAAATATASIPAPNLTFEGLNNTDNFNIFGFRVNPPDPVGDVGPRHYVQMVNLVYAVYDKQGNMVAGPVDTGTLWANFPIEDCTDPSGDPIVIYDQLVGRWILSQFTTRGPLYYNCVAISKTGDPTGVYYRYAFSAGEFFPDYPKYGVWTNSYLLTSRDFGPTVEYGISVYALEKNKMLGGQPDARAVQFFLDSEIVPLELIGDGLLPADIDGTRRPQAHVPAPIVGTQDNDSPYGATFDALNIWDLSVKWNATPEASLTLAAQLPVASFDSIFPCGGSGGNSRDCLYQPGVGPTQRLDILSYRQRPTWRLAYRNTGDYETMVTNQSVEALPGLAGVRWYEIRRVGDDYSLFQQGTFTLNDGVHRWMGSAAMDKKGNIALGYSVVNGVDVYPGIRYTARMAGDPLGQMTLGEAVMMNGTGVQTTTNSRWGDYTSLNLDPVDDCTFWYVNEYYTLASQATSAAGWLTRIGSFTLPGCK